jgi:PAS domain S-box-containing protein
MTFHTIAPPKQNAGENHQSVTRLLIILIAAVFLTEAFIMNALDWVPSMSKSLSTLLDASLLSLLLFPIFYFLIFRPLVRNISQRAQIEAELRIAAVAFEIKDPTVITDADANIVRANQKLLDKLGYRLDEVVGQNPRIFKSGLHDERFYAELWKELLQQGTWSGEIRIKTKEGRILHPFWLSITAVKNEKMVTTHYIGIYNF